MIKDLTGADGILKYIIDRERYWPEEALKEALGCKDDDIFGEIKKLREERERYKSNCDYFAGIAEDKLCDRNKLELELREALGTVDEYADIPGLVRKLKKERDELEDRVRTYRVIANGTYGDSCGYSSSKQPAFLCDVISYSWNFGALDTPFPNNSIRVELDLTPTASYKGTLDLEDLKRYIQEYGREKKLGVIESVDYQNAKAARAELAYLYKTVLGKEKLDRDLSPHEVMKAIHDEYKRVRDAQFASDQCLRSVYMHVHEGTEYSISDIYAAPDKLADEIITRYNSARMLSRLETLKEIDDHIDELCDKHNVVQPSRSKTTRERLDYIFSVIAQYRDFFAEGFKKEKRAAEDSLAELRAKVREIYRSVVDDEWDESLSYTSALNDINEEYKRVVHNFEERTADWSKAQQEYSRYRLAVGSLLDIPKDVRDDINAIERAFEFSKKKYKSLQEFRDSVCEILDIPSSMADDQEQILKEIHDFADRYYELRDFRADICGILDIESLTGTLQQNDKYILEQVEKLRNDNCDAEKEFLDGVKQRIGVNADCSDSKYMLRLLDIKLDHSSLSAFTDSVYEALGISRYDCTLTEAIDELKKRIDRYARFRSNICTALCLGGETSDKDILNSIAETRKKDNDLTVFRNDVAKAIGLTWTDSNSDIIKRVEEIRESHDRLARLWSDICSAFCLGDETCDGNIIGRIHDKLCKDYTEFRKAIWAAMDRKPETLPEETARLVGEVTELKRGEKLLIGFRDDVAKAIGMDYPTTNQVILHNVKYLHKDREDAYDMVSKLNDQVTELVKAKEDLQQKFDASQKQVKDWTNRCDSLEDQGRDLRKLRKNAIEDLKNRGFFFRPEEDETLPEIYTKLLKRYDWTYGSYKEQYRLRQCWHARWESENERANGVQKALDREREKCRVLETAKKQYEKVCGNLETAECALNGMKSKVRELREEKTKVITAIGQDIWDDCLK